MARNPWAYHVSNEARRREVAENTAILAQIAACQQAGLAAVMDAWVAAGYEAAAEPWMLPFLSEGAALAVGVVGEDLAALAAYIEVDAAPYPWVPALAPRDWYNRGKHIAEALESRFGAVVEPADRWLKRCSTAQRRLRVATAALRW